MTTQGWIFLGLAIIAYYLLHTKRIFKNYKVVNFPWYGKVLTIFFALGCVWAFLDAIDVFVE